MNRKTLALGRLPAGTMNRTEFAYAQELLLRERCGQILWSRFEGITFKIAHDTRYTPDFAVMLAGGVIELHEVKGVWTDDAKVKLRVAAGQYPFRFVVVTALPRGGWHLEEVKTT